MTIKIGYFRVSKEDEKIQELQPQIDAVISKFNLDETLITYIERGTAYDVDKVKDRKEFLSLIKRLFNSNITTIEDLFLGNYTKQDIELYVWDYHRIMRNFKFSLLFGLLSDFFNIKIFSYKQDNIEVKENEKPIDTFSRYIFYSINAFSSEDYSYNISENVKKVIHKEGSVTVSSRGNKWGSKFKDKDDNKIELTSDQINKMNNKIYKLIKHYEKYNIKFYYKFIIANILKLYKVKLSKSYITVLKKNDTPTIR